MANKNFEIKNGLTIGGTERITSAGEFTGSLASSATATTQSALDNSTKIATTAYTDAAITTVIGGAPGTLDTLNELAAAINDDASYASTLTTALATKLPLAGGTMTGVLNMGSNNLSGINNGTAVSFLSTNGYWSGGTQRINGSGDLVNIGTVTAAGIDTQQYRILQGTSQAGGIFKERTITGTGVSNNISIFAESISDGGEIHFMTGGSVNKRMTIDSSGRVGIGTTDPKSTLEVKGTFGAPASSGSAAGFISRFSQTSGAGSLDVGFGDPYSWLQSRASNNYATNYALALNPNGGNVGIGQTSPATTLHIGSGQANFIRIHNAASGDVTSGLNITRGDSLGMQLYDNPADDTTTLNASGNFNIRTDSTSYRIFVKDNGSVAVGGNANAGHSFEVQDRSDGYSTFWSGRSSSGEGRGLTTAYGLLGGTSTQYDGDGAYYPVYGFGGAADNASAESVDFWIKSSTSEWQPMVFFCIGASTNTGQTGQTAGWALIRATHYNNGVSTSILDSGGGGTFSLAVISGSLDSNDVMQVRITYSGGQNRANISVWCNTYQQIRGAQRS